MNKVTDLCGIWQGLVSTVSVKSVGHKCIDKTIYDLYTRVDLTNWR